MNFLKGISILTAIIVILCLIYPKTAGLVLIFSIFIYGAIAGYAKTLNEKIALLAGLLVISATIILFNGIKFGLDFNGGTRIPVFLSSPVDNEVMAEITEKLKTRISTLGLEQVIVKPIGNDRLFIEIPSSNPEQAQRIEEAITTQGVFIAVVDGIIVLEGRDIIPGTISNVPSQSLGGADWGVSFTITREAAERFSNKVRGKANRPLFLFLDKPYNATILIDESWLISNAQMLSANGINVTPADILFLIEDVLKDERGNVNIVLYKDNETKIIGDNIITSKRIAEKIADNKSLNIKIVDEKDLYPELSVAGNNLIIVRWGAAGLMSAPLLNPSVTSGNTISLTYQITGNAPTNLTLNEKAIFARQQERFISSVLKGGALPVKLYIGSKETIPALLGEKFLSYSIYALALSIIAVSIFVALRYRKLSIVLPVIVITIIELIILVAAIGSFSIDMAAMAGLIAAMGVSIDAQVIITDEVIKHKNKEEAIKKAFSIISSNVLVAILVFLPLFFTHIVEVIGFAVVTIISYILGALISRPAYAALMEIIVK